MHPKVEQEKTQTDQQEAIRRIGRGRPTQRFVFQAIAGLNPESFAVSLPTLLRTPVQVNHHKQQPFGATLASFGTPSRREHAAQGDLRRKLFVLTFIESVLGAITLPSLTQRPRPSFFAAYRTRNQRGLLATAQILENRDAGKTFVEIENTDHQPTRPHHSPQILHYIHGLIARQYESNCQGDPLSVDNRISRRHAIEMSRPIFGFAAHPQALLLFLLAVVFAVVKIKRDFNRATASQPPRPVSDQAAIDTSLQLRQPFDRQLLPEIAADGLRIRGSGQFRADRLDRSFTRRNCQQDVIEHLARGAISVCFKRQVDCQCFFCLAQDFFIVKLRLIIRGHGLVLPLLLLFVKYKRKRTSPYLSIFTRRFSQFWVY